MLKKIAALTALIVFVCMLHLSASTYYLDFTNGSNSNDGLSPATAWKDLFKIRALGPSPGDVFLFKRGERWEGLQMYVTASGTAAQPITYGAYGNLADGPPIISSIIPIDMADGPSNWTEACPNIWTLSAAVTPGRLFLDGVEYLRASTLADVGTTDGQGAFAHWFYDGTNSLLYLYATQNPANAYSEIKGSSLFNSVQVFDASHMIFENLDFQGGSGASLSLNGASHVEVRHCQLGHSANSGLTVIDAVVNNSRQASSNIVIWDNVFDSNFTFFYGLGSERGCGDGLKFFYGANNCLAYDNTFINWAHNAVELLGSISSASGVHNNKVYDNYITAPDIPYAHPFGVDGLMGKCQQNEIYRNYIEDCRTASQINGNDNWVHHNIIVGMRNSPSKNQPTAHAFSMGIYGAGLVSEDNRFDHNLIIDTDEAAFLIRGYGFSGQAKGHKIRNNIIYETGAAPYGNAYAEGTGLVIYDTNQDGVGGNTYQNNLFYSSTPGAKAVYIQDNDSHYTTAEFNLLNGMDGNIIQDNIPGDPLFTNLNTNNYLPQSNSPAVNAGIDVGLSLDYDLNPRLLGPAPDIGPLETNVTVLPVHWGRFWVECLESQKVALYWETLAERQSDHFIIERSTEGQKWEAIGRTPARGISHQLELYRFVDPKPPLGPVYYRLKQVDWDGSWEYSRLAGCKVSGVGVLRLARPDPHTLRLLSDKTVDWRLYHIRLFDATGRQWVDGIGRPEVNIQGLPAGAYVLMAEGPGEVAVWRLIR